MVVWIIEKIKKGSWFIEEIGGEFWGNTIKKEINVSKSGKNIESIIWNRGHKKIIEKSGSEI